MTPEPHHDNHELLSERIGITASSATAQSQVNRETTGTSKVNVSHSLIIFMIQEYRCIFLSVRELALEVITIARCYFPSVWTDKWRTYITFLLSNSSALTCTTVQHCPAVDERPATCDVQSRKHYSLTPYLTAFTVLRAVWQRKSQGCSFWRVPGTYSLMNILNTSNKSARCQKAGPKKSHMCWTRAIARILVRRGFEK